MKFHPNVLQVYNKIKPYSLIYVHFNFIRIIDKVFATYEFEPKRTYGGESINCGLYRNRKALEMACTANYECIGYSTISSEHPKVKNLSYVEELEAENGFYPWCMKRTEDWYKADEQQNYYRRTRGIEYNANKCIIN